MKRRRRVKSTVGQGMSLQRRLENQDLSSTDSSRCSRWISRKSDTSLSKLTTRKEKVGRTSTITTFVRPLPDPVPASLPASSSPASSPTSPNQLGLPLPFPRPSLPGSTFPKLPLLLLPPPLAADPPLSISADHRPGHTLALPLKSPSLFTPHSFPSPPSSSSPSSSSSSSELTTRYSAPPALPSLAPLALPALSTLSKCSNIPTPVSSPNSLLETPLERDLAWRLSRPGLGRSDETRLSGTGNEGGGVEGRLDAEVGDEEGDGRGGRGGEGRDERGGEGGGAAGVGCGDAPAAVIRERVKSSSATVVWSSQTSFFWRRQRSIGPGA